MKFIINGKYENEENHIAFNDIDINKQWIISVGLYFQDAVLGESLQKKEIEYDFR